MNCCDCSMPMFPTLRFAWARGISASSSRCVSLFGVGDGEAVLGEGVV